MAKMLVTGGAGFIGSHIVDGLVQRGDEVTVVDNLSTGFRHNLSHHGNQVELVQGDVTDAETLSHVMKGVDTVFHLAALASVPRSVESPLDSHHACATGTVTVLDQARKAGVRRVVYAASSSAYGDQPNSSKRETDLTSPLSPYAAAKLSGELYCQAFFHTYGLETVGLRYFNVFGPRQDPDSPYSAVIPLFITALLNGRRPVVYGDGNQSRDFTFVTNVVHGNLLASSARNVGGKIINMANGVTTSLLALLKHLREMLEVEVQPVHEPSRVGDVRDSLADITLARNLLGYETQVHFEEGLARSIEYYRSMVEANS